MYRSFSGWFLVFSFILLLAFAYIPLRDCLLLRFILSLPYVKRYLFFFLGNEFCFKQALLVYLSVRGFFFIYYDI